MQTLILLPRKTFKAATQVWEIFLPESIQAGIKWKKIFLATERKICQPTIPYSGKIAFQKK